MGFLCLKRCVFATFGAAEAACPYGAKIHQPEGLPRTEPGILIPGDAGKQEKTK
jgi:hypothetical protein